MTTFLRLRQIALVAEQLAPTVDAFREVFDIEVAFRDPGVAQFGLENAVMPVGRQFLEVVAPTHDDTAAGRYLARRFGDGGYMVILQADDHGPAKGRASAAGIRTAFEHNDHGYRVWQLHPGDTGGSFLEVDVQEGGEATDGPWTPAGKNWMEFERTEVVRGIAAAEIQSPEPGRLADRWAGVLGAPVTIEEGDPSIVLDNATIRFVEASDGRGEGLGGIDLVAVNAAAAFASASRLGLAVDGHVIHIGGVRCRLLLHGS